MLDTTLEALASGVVFYKQNHMKPTTYTFDGEEGLIEIPLEKWAWKVVYVPTEDQLARAKEETIARNEKIIAERDRVVKELGSGKDAEARVAEARLTAERATELDVRAERDELKQFDDDGKFHQIQEIDWSRVEEFIMYRPDRALKRFTLYRGEKTLQFFLFKRNIVLRANAVDELRYIAYVFGWKDPATGATSYNYILPDDSIVSSTEDDVDLVKYIT